MHVVASLTPSQVPDFLLNVALQRPVMLWGPPGIGKSSLVERFAAELGLPCVSLLGSQLAPEDLIGVPQVVDGVSRFCPPAMIARPSPYCLFLDELNASSAEVMKAFYSLIHERRIGEYLLPKGSIVIGAGNRAKDTAIVRPMPAPLINRMVHVSLRVSHRDWLSWAGGTGIHPLVLEYVQQRPDHLWSEPPKTEEPFSTPRSWHILSDGLHAYGDGITDDQLAALARGTLTPAHAATFLGWVQVVRDQYSLAQILKGERSWPDAPAQRDVLYYLATQLRAQLIKELPEERPPKGAVLDLAHRAKARLAELAGINLELAQLVVADDHGGRTLPTWFLTEVARDLPRLVEKQPK